MGRVKKYKKQNKSTSAAAFDLDEDYSDEDEEYKCPGIGCNGCESCILSDSENSEKKNNESSSSVYNENEEGSEENEHNEGSEENEHKEGSEENEYNEGSEDIEGRVGHELLKEKEDIANNKECYDKYSVILLNECLLKDDSSDNTENTKKIEKIEKTKKYRLSTENSVIRTPPYVRTLFPYSSSIKYENLRMTKIGLYSISNRHDSGTLTRILSQCFQSWNKTNIVITDGTAGIGGNSLAFGMSFKRVNAIEWDEIQYEALKCNVNVYGLKNIECYQGDCMKLIPMLRQHVIFLDPPWGGKSYKNEKEIDLMLNDVPLVDIVNRWRKECRKLEMIAIKIPKNFSLKEFANKSFYPFMYLLYFRKYNVLILSERHCKPIEHRHYTNYIKKRRNSI